MTYIPFIYVTMPNGFVESTKFIKEVELSSLKVNDNIRSFYNETFPLYNIYLRNEDNTYTLFKDNVLCSLTQSDIKEQIFISFSQFLNQVVSSGATDLLSDYKNDDGSIDRVSIFKEYLQHIEWQTSVSLTPVIENFSLNQYTQLANELTFLADCLDDVKLQHFIKGSVKAFNTFLAYNNIINDFSHGMFSTEREANTEKEVIYFGNATQSIYYAKDMCDASFDFGIKKDSKKLRI